MDHPPGADGDGAAARTVPRSWTRERACPNLSRAWAWLRARPDVPYVAVTHAERHHRRRSSMTARDGSSATQRFVLRREGGKGTRALRFRSCGALARGAGRRDARRRLGDRRCAAPRGIAREAGRVCRRHHRMGHRTTLAGPLVRLVTTVVVPYRDNGRRPEAAPVASGPVGAGAVRGRFRPSRSRCGCARMPRRPRSPTCTSRVACRIATTTPVRPGDGDRAAVYDVLGRDAMPGNYELVVQASQFEAASVNVSVSCSPRCAWGCRARPRASRPRCRT